MTAEELIYNTLKNNPDIRTTFGNRIYPQVLPQRTTLPALVLFKVSDPRPQAHSGDSGLSVGRFQITAFATDFQTVKEVMPHIRAALAAHKANFLDEGDLPYEQRSGVFGRFQEWQFFNKEA